jgi:hypothetical protein
MFKFALLQIVRIVRSPTGVQTCDHRTKRSSWKTHASFKFGFSCVERTGVIGICGRPGHTPKRIDCKAKTADIDIAPYRLAGLVVDPGTHPKAFKPGKTAKAADCWAAMKPLLGQPHRRGAKVLTVQNFVNAGIGSPMIQHGGEGQYADHSEQSIDAFGPNGEDVTILNEFSVRSWYEKRFGGRKVLV